MSQDRRSAESPAPRRFALLLAVLVLAALTVRLAPPYLPAPAAFPPAVPDGPHLVFGYATLANPLVRYAVVGRAVPSEAAALSGWERQGRNLVVAPDARVRGRLFSVSPEELTRLDRYERAGDRYRRLPLALDDGQVAWVYVFELTVP